MATSEPAPSAAAPASEPQASGESADRLRRALASSLDGFWEYDLRSEQAWYSDGLRRLLGYSRETLPDGHGRLSGFLHPDDLAAYQAAVDASFADRAAFEREARLRDGEGRWRWVRCRGRIWPGDDGRAHLLSGSITDVHESHEARAALERMRERYERAILATPHGLFERWLDEDRMFIADRIWHALGYEPGELPSTRSALMGLMHPDDTPGYEATVARAAEHGHLDVYLRLRGRSGAYRWFQQIASLHAEPGGRVRVTGVLIDVDDAMCARQTLERDRAELERLVTERTTRLEAALAQAEQARAEAERATAAKSHFLAHMSHEIRTPLNGVLGLTELALQMATAPTQRRHLEVALQSGQALLQVVDEVLAFSRTQGEAEPPADEPFDLPELLATTLRSVMPLVRGRDVVVRFDVLGRRSRVRGDAGRLRQIVINLLGNALKFTERGHVGLGAEIVDGDDGRCRMTLRVEDTGPGIPPEQHERVFEPFVQVDQSLSRRYGGTGLGLATARAVARSMGGELVLASRVGEGTVFTLTLSLAADGPPDAPVRAPARPVWLLAPDPRRVLWLDERLRRIGCATWLPDTAAAIVERAAAVLPRERPGALLLTQWSLTDAGMLHALRAALPTTSTVLLLRPDWHEPAIERTAEMLGMETAMLPLTPAALARLVQRPADVPPSPDTVAAELAQADGTAPAAPLRRHVLLVEDNPVNRMIGEGFLHALGLPTRTAEDGAQALDACARETPALVLMDLQMPVMDGLEATRRLRSAQREGRLPPFPIVALTAHALQTDRDRAAEAGMDGYLTKPLLLEALRAELQRWLPALGEA